jgi:predicted RNA polymerase sigma factor
MPTTKPRYMITQNDLVAEALADAARQWPEDGGSCTKLLLRLIEAGHQSLCDDSKRRRREQLAAIESTAGILQGVFNPGDLQQLHEEWPA